jgi:hypothetical protein
MTRLTRLILAFITLDDDGRGADAPLAEHPHRRNAELRDRSRRPGSVAPRAGVCCVAPPRAPHTARSRAAHSQNGR